MGLIKAGTCVFIPDDNRPHKLHLHVVLNDPTDDHPPTVAAVSWSTGITSDKTVILKVGEHSFIKEDTYVVYGLTRILNANHLEADVIADMNRRHRHACPPQLLEKIKQGVFKSDFTTQRVEAYCREHFSLGGQ
jgi:hypothetical protein